jgi:putative transposase
LVYENWKQTSARKPLCLSDARALGLRDKYRRGVFTAQVLHDLRNIFTSVCSDFESQLMEFDGEERPCTSARKLPAEDHGCCPRELPQGRVQSAPPAEKPPSIRGMLWGKALWSPSYFAGSCGGAPIAVIRQYIEQQRTPD